MCYVCVAKGSMFAGFSTEPDGQASAPFATLGYRYPMTDGVAVIPWSYDVNKTATPDGGGFVQSTYTLEVERALDAFEVVGNIDFVYTADATGAKVLVGTGTIDGPSGTLAVAGSAYFTETGLATTGDAKFEPVESWTYATNDIEAINFQTVAMHEFGHVLGLDHEPLASSIALMNPIYNPDVLGLRPDDINAVRSLYGTRNGDINGNVDIGGRLDDRVVGSGQNDYLRGYEGQDVLIGGDGNDSLLGDTGNDDLQGNAGNDTIFGGDGADTLRGGQGIDTVSGGTGDDQVYGGVLNDLLFGDAGADLFYAGLGDDTLYGGEGADTLFGARDADLLVGNGGADRFIQSLGADTVADFEIGVDTLQLTTNAALGLTSAAGVAARGTDIAGGVRIDLGNGDSMTLLGVNKAQLTQLNYLFL